MDAFTDMSTLEICGVAALLGGLAYIGLSRQRAALRRSRIASSEKTETKLGEWTPVDFAYPEIEPIESDALQLQPRAYRPFRWDTYHVTMGIRPMIWTEWLQIDDHFPRYHAIRARRMRDCGKLAVRTMPEAPGVVRGGLFAARELAHEFAEFLSRRYPTTFKVTRNSPGRSSQGAQFGWYGEGNIKTITIAPMGITYDLDKDDPMRVAGLLVPDDVVLTLEGQDGQYYFQAGAVCIPGTWHMDDKIGKALDEIHLSGDVPHYRDKLQTSLNRFFRKMTVDKPVTRYNYLIQICKDAAADPYSVQMDADADMSALDPDEVSWSETIMGAEDRSGPQPTFESLAEYVKPELMRIRIERQTLRRLPKSGAIAFIFRTYMYKIEDLCKEPGVPGRLASSIRHWPQSVQEYKRQPLFREVLLRYLDGHHTEQIARGEVDENDRSSDYPF